MLRASACVFPSCNDICFIYIYIPIYVCVYVSMCTKNVFIDVFISNYTHIHNNVKIYKIDFHFPFIRLNQQCQLKSETIRFFIIKIIFHFCMTRHCVLLFQYTFESICFFLLCQKISNVKRYSKENTAFCQIKRRQKSMILFWHRSQKCKI